MIPDVAAPAATELLRRRSDAGPAQRLLDAALGGLAPLLVLPSLLPLFAGGGVGWLLAAAVLPTLVAGVSVVVGSRQPEGDRESLWLGPGARLVADVVAVVILLALVPTVAGGRSTLAGLASGGAKLVTAALPAVPGGPELGAVVVAMALAAGIGAELGLRSRSDLAPAAPTLVLYAAALAVGAGGLTDPTWDAVVMVAGLAVTVVLRRMAPMARPASGPSAPSVLGGRSSRPPIPWRVLAVGAALAAVAAAVAVPLGHGLPGGSTTSHYDVRAALRPAVAPPPGLNPLVTYANVYDSPPVDVMTVHASGDDVNQVYWRVDALSHFTATGWTSTTSLLPAGNHLPPGPKQAGPVLHVTADVILQQRSLVYLPAPDRPTDVSVPGLRVDPQTGVLAVSPGQKAPSHYEVAASVPAPTDTQIEDAVAAPLDDPGAAAPSDAVANVANTLIRQVAPTPFARLTAVQRYLTSGPFVLHPAGDSPIGSDNVAVATLLQDHDGSSAQYAAAFALLARSLGYNARVAIGYRGGTTSPTTGLTQFTTRDLLVWPEVELEGIGWQPFPADPATGAGPQSHAQDSPASPLVKALNQQAQVNQGGQPKPTQTSVPPRQPPPVRHSSGGFPWVVVPIAVVVLLLLALVGLVVVKGLRRRRQRAGPDPGLRVDGAWDCVLDRLAEYGVELVPSLTVPEVVERATGTCGAQRVGPLGDLVGVVDARRYNRQVPPSSATADLAWDRAEAVDRSLRTGVPATRRLRALLSTAPFRR